MRAAARAAVRAGEGHDAHVALERLFAAVVDRVQLRAAVELDVDGVILIDVPVRRCLDLQQLLPRNVGVEVDGHALHAHVEAHIVAAVARADQPRADVLAGVLLHMVEAPRPVDLPVYGRADGQGRGAFVRDDARPFVYVQHLGAAEHTGVIRLPAALGIERRAVEHDGEAVLDRLAREHPRVKFRQKGVGVE